MTREMAKFSVNWHEVLRPRKHEHLRQLIPACVPRYVHRRDRLVEYFGTKFVEPIHQRVDGALVAGNKARREHHDILRFDLYSRMGAVCEFGQRREWLTLAAAGQIRDFSRRQELGFGGFDEGSWVERKLPGFETQADAFTYPTSKWSHAASKLCRHFGNLTKAMEMRGERREEKPLARSRHDFAQHRFKRTLGRGTAGAFHVGRIRKQQDNSLPSQLREAVAIEDFVVDRGLIDLEIAGVDDRSSSGANRKSDGIRSRMGYTNRLDFKRTGSKTSPRQDRHQRDFLLKRSFRQAAPDECQGEIGSIDGRLDAPQ